MRIAVAFLTLLCVTCVTPITTPQAAVTQFYGAYVQHRPPGLPEGQDLEQMRPMLSERLYALIVAANQYSAQFAKDNPDDKPPFVDGDFFTSSFEGPQSFTITSVEGNDVHVRFGYENVTWNDVIVVTQEHGRYVIDDVKYGGAGEFNPPGVLSERLTLRYEP